MARKDTLHEVKGSLARAKTFERALWAQNAREYHRALFGSSLKGYKGRQDKGGTVFGESEKMTALSNFPVAPDGRHIVVHGRPWRRTNPNRSRRNGRFEQALSARSSARSGSASIFLRYSGQLRPTRARCRIGNGPSWIQLTGLGAVNEPVVGKVSGTPSTARFSSPSSSAKACASSRSSSGIPKVAT